MSHQDFGIYIEICLEKIRGLGATYAGALWLKMGKKTQQRNRTTIPDIDNGGLQKQQDAR